MRTWSLSDLALSRPVTIGMSLLAVVLLGIIGLARMPLSFLPRDQATRVFVRVEINRISPEVLEREVIRPLEEAVAGLRGLQRSQIGSGSWGVRMNLEFEAGSDLDARKLELRDRVDRVRGELPEFVTNIEIGSHSNADEPVMELRIASGTDLSGDYYLIEQHIVRAVERIDGVARVELEGVSPHELEIALDLEEARRTGVSLAEIGTAVRDARQGRSMGSLRDADREAGVRAPAAPATPERFAELPVRRGADVTAAPASTLVPQVTLPGSSASTASTRSTTTATPRAGTTGTTTAAAPVARVTTAAPASNGFTPMIAAPTTATPVTTASGVTLIDTTALADSKFATVGEVAEVTAHPEEQRSGSRLNGRRAIQLEVFAASGASVVDVTQRVRDTLDRLHADPALDGIEVLVVQDQGAIILKTLADLRDSGIYGGILAAVVLFLFLHRFGITLAASLSVPLSVLAAGAVLFVRGEELNCVVLLGLVLGVGMLIDNAVVIVEAIASHARAGKPPLVAARDGAREVGFATVASTASTVIVFLPLIANNPTDQMSAYLRPLGITFAIGLIASLFVSQLAVPLMMGRARWLARPPARHPLLERVAAGYGWIIRRTLRWPKLVLVVGLALAASAVWPSVRLELKLGRADIKPDHLPIRLEFTGSRNFERIQSYVEVLDQALLDRKDELQIASVSCNYGDMWSNCRVYPREAFQSEHELLAFEDRVRQVLPEQAGLRYRVNETEFDWHENNDRRVVEFAIKGDNMATLKDIADRVAEHLAANLQRGDADDPEAGGYDLITTPYTDGARELHITLDGDRLHRFGLTPNQVAERVGLAFQGMPLGRLRGERGELRLRMSTAGDGDKGPSVDDVRALRIPLPGGGDTTVGAIATTTIERRPWWIQRVDRQTEVRLGVRFFTADPKANFEIVSKAMESFTFPPGYAWGRGTQWRMQKQANADMLINLGLCLLLVYAVMASLFESFGQPAGILVTCLLGSFGAPWALWATGTTVDATAIVGMFILIGVVVNNGIMLVDRVIQLRGQGLERRNALEQAGRDRLRPILMTVTTTVLGLVPMLVHHPTLAGVYYHAIAIVVAGGLLTSTLITLVFLPAAYCVIEDIGNAMLRSWRRFGVPARRP